MNVELSADKTLKIQFSYDPAVVVKVKTLDNRKFDAKNSVWEASMSYENVERLINWGFTVLPEIKTWWDEQNKKTEMPRVRIPPMRRPLYPFQIEAVQFIEEAKGRTIIGDQQGLGKSAEQLAWLQLHPEIRPVVIVCPGSAKWTYHSEVKYVLTKKNRICVIAGDYNKNKPPLPDADIYIINYDILFTTTACVFCNGKGKKDDKYKTIKCYACKGKGKIVHVRHDLIHALKSPRAVILDESQFLQEPDSFRTQAVKKLCEGVPHVLASSGTPIRHRPKNFFTTLNLVRPDIFPSYWSFAHKFCGAEEKTIPYRSKDGRYKTRTVWTFTGATDMEELHKMLVRHKVLLRRTKKEVLPQLPPLRRLPVMLELNAEQCDKYQQASSNFLNWLKNNDVTRLSNAKKAEALVKMGYLQQMAARFKIEQVIEWVDVFLDSGNALILYAHHRAIVDRLYDHFKDIAVRVDGSSTAEQKRDAETAFQACGKCGIKKDKHAIEHKACQEYTPGKIQLFIGTLAAKESLTLTAAYDVAFVELWDSPADHSQAEERCFGRISDPHGATAWYFIANDTIEESILENQEYKRKVIDAIVDGHNVADDSLVKLLENIKQKGQAPNEKKKEGTLL